MTDFDDIFSAVAFPPLLDRNKTTVVFKNRVDDTTAATADAVVSDAQIGRGADDMDVSEHWTRTVSIAAAQTPAFTPDRSDHYVTIGSDDYSIVDIQRSANVNVCSVRRGKSRIAGVHGQG